MPRQMLLMLFVSVITLCWISVGDASDNLQWSELPAPVREACLKRYPQGKMGIAYVIPEDDDEDGPEVYYIQLENKKQEIFIQLKEDGTVRKISINVPEADLPEAGTTMLREKYPKSVVTLACKLFTVREGKDVLTSYHIELNTKGHGRRSMEVEPNGKITTDYVNDAEFVTPLRPSTTPLKPK